MLPDWIVIGEEFLHKRLTDNGDALRSRSVMLIEAASAHNGSPDGFKVMHADSVPGRTAVRDVSLTLNVNAFAPVVALLRGIESQCFTEHAWCALESVFQRLVEPDKPLLRVARNCRINLDDQTPLSFKAKLLVL